MNSGTRRDSELGEQYRHCIHAKARLSHHNESMATARPVAAAGLFWSYICSLFTAHLPPVERVQPPGSNGPTNKQDPKLERSWQRHVRQGLLFLCLSTHITLLFLVLDDLPVGWFCY